MKALLMCAAVIAALGTSGCNKESKLLGEPAPSDAVRATVQSIAEDAAKYSGKTIVVEGRISGGCSDGDGVVLSDKTWRIEVKAPSTAGFQIPVRPGARMRAWGIISVEKEESKHSEAHSEKKKLGEAEKQHEESEVTVVARGVEWL